MLLTVSCVVVKVRDTKHSTYFSKPIKCLDCISWPKRRHERFNFQAAETTSELWRQVHRPRLHPLQWLRPLQGDAKAKIHVEITRRRYADKPPQFLRELCDCQGLHPRWCVMCHVEIIPFACQTAQMSPKMISERMEGAAPCHDYNDGGPGPDGCWWPPEGVLSTLSKYMWSNERDILTFLL